MINVNLFIVLLRWSLEKQLSSMIQMIISQDKPEENNNTELSASRYHTNGFIGLQAH